MNCPHITKSNFNAKTVLESVKSKQDRLLCSACDKETESRWLCLTCGTISCGRFESGHGFKHYQNTKDHPAAIDILTKACHWYLVIHIATSVMITWMLEAKNQSWTN
jgi:uncharacterized UBP type Zn finger protein